MGRSKSMEERESKGLILRTLERCKSLGHGKNSSQGMRITKFKPWPRVGWVTVYVGPDKERFAIRTESINHPLFKELLDEAESVYGYPCEGPIELPCSIDYFDRVLWEIGECEEVVERSPLCSFTPSPIRGFRPLVKGHAGYRVPNPSRFVITG